MFKELRPSYGPVLPSRPDGRMDRPPSILSIPITSANSHPVCRNGGDSLRGMQLCAPGKLCCDDGAEWDRPGKEKEQREERLHRTDSYGAWTKQIVSGESVHNRMMIASPAPQRRFFCGTSVLSLGAYREIWTEWSTVCAVYFTDSIPPQIKPISKWGSSGEKEEACLWHKPSASITTSDLHVVAQSSWSNPKFRPGAPEIPIHTINPLAMHVNRRFDTFVE